MPLVGNQLRFCSRQHGNTWHNHQGHWKERKDRFSRNAKKRAAYKANPEYWRNRQKAWREANPEQSRLIYERQKAKHPLSPWRRMVIAAKQRATAKAMPFDLTFEWASKRWTGFCELTNLPFVVTRENGATAIFSPSLDRIIPVLGYVQTNCRFVLLGINGLKNDGTDEAMYLVAEALLAYKTTLIGRTSYIV